MVAIAGGGDVSGRWVDEAGRNESAEEEKIVVSVRLRPLNAKEIARNEGSDWECISSTDVVFRNNLLPAAVYSFDRVFRCECTTRQVYEEGAKEVALSVVSGINASIFAYGQTSSGKTYTMNGITEYTVADIYDYIKRHEDRDFVLKFSAMEIYNEAVKDLLNMENASLRVLDDPERGPIVERLTEETLRDCNHLKQLLSMCEAQRQTGDTLLNEASSRSHQILRLTVESSACELLGKDRSSTLVANVTFVDLAGSERASLALPSGTRLKEGCHINRSLLTLGTVIRKLSKGGNGHVPYRDSKLTRILQPSLGGNARTAIICTISPARSHIEQSRNTLLFARCAKEVATSSRVNVVISEQALVKHLQKELARLESELRYPGTSPSTNQLEILLREKDAQIKKMGKQMRELIQERDLAQSRLEDLIQLEGDDYALREWEEAKQISISSVPVVCKDILSTLVSSSVSCHDLDFGSTKFRKSLGSNNEMGHHQQHSEKPIKKDAPSPSHSVSSSVFDGPVSCHGYEENAQDTHEDVKDYCKEVQCIEVDEPIRSGDPSLFATSGSDNLLHLNESTTRYGYNESKTKGQTDVRIPSTTNPTFITLDQHLQNVRKTFDSLDKSYMWSKGLTLSRSRSCRANLMNSPPPWFQETGQNGSTPPCSSLSNFPGRPEMSQRRHFVLNYNAETEMPPLDGSGISEETISNNLYGAQKLQNSRAAYKGNFTSISEVAAELKEMAEGQQQKQQTDYQEMDGNAKNVGLNPVVGPTESPSRWPLEFEKKQHEIIELWHECNVSLVHRTYFFLLFKGDSADSIYMEVELRRLLFLRRTFSRRNLGKTVLAGHENVSLIASLKVLQRERAMLCRQMKKKMSLEERKSLYVKWGISLDSKKKRLQLACRLWTKTCEMEHVRESALTVVKLVMLLEPGQALKEMFGLSFTPQQSWQRTYSWKRALSSLK